MQRVYSPPPPPPADTSASTPAFFAEDDDSSDDTHEHTHAHTYAPYAHAHTRRNARMATDSTARVSHESRRSRRSQSSVSTTSLILERLGETDADTGEPSTSLRTREFDDDDGLAKDADLETGPFLARHETDAPDDTPPTYTKMDPKLRRWALVVGAAVAVLWLAGLGVYVWQQAYKHASSFEHDPEATASRGSLSKMTRAMVDGGVFQPRRASISWVAGADGEDGMMLETSRAAGTPFLVAADVRAAADSSADSSGGSRGRTLVADATFTYAGRAYTIATATPSGNLEKVLVSVNRTSNWRHSSVAAFFVLDVATQTVEPLVPGEPGARVQLAQWAPTGDAVAFTRDNNLFVRRIPADATALATEPVTQVTHDGGPELFYGVPDWVYEEEVFGGASATWWAPDGRYVAFLRTNETGVPSYPVQYFIDRPSGTTPEPGAENYPEVREIKYPKAGAHNPVVDLQFVEVATGHVFSVDVAGDFGDGDRLITTVLWAGDGRVLVKETNRISDVMRVVLIDVAAQTGRAVRTVDVGALDGGWFEIATTTRFVPADPDNGRPHDGYLDTVVHNDGDHLAYFAPPDNPEPVMLTAGNSDAEADSNWEVVKAPSGVDLANNLVYFVATVRGAGQRHVYSASLLDGSQRTPLVDDSAPAFYSASFSTGAGFVLLEYGGPGVPWQKVMTTPAHAARSGSAFEHTLEDNRALAEVVRKHALPTKVYGTIDVATEDGSTVALNYVERRPPHFSPDKQYPVLFQQYSGPGSQEVKHEFKVDFQSYAAATLGYVVVTVDPRGTGFRGRAHRVNTRRHIGLHEAHDHIAAAKHWAARPYVDADRLAIWGWSYGGFTTLKTLERDAGRTFRYGIAVAPVTDWRFYDSIYTERYMDTPQRNAAGYDQSAVRNASALAQNVRFLIMHGVADDNVHMQNSLALLDRLDLAGVSNYDVHVFPDSDHSIYFHNGHAIVFDKIENWLINAFNGEWLKVGSAVP